VKLTKLGEGVYVDEEDGSLHLDLPELCVANGYEPTPENQDALGAAALLVFGDTPIEVEEIPDGGRGRWRT
jgi:hypothetical protein